MIQLWLGGLAILIVQGTLWRVLLMALFSPPHLPTSDLPGSFFLGARFDLTVACYVFVIPLLIWLVDRMIRLVPALDSIRLLLERILRPLTVPFLAILFAIVTFVSMIDIGFYGFFQDRLNVLMFGFFNDDTTALIKTLWKNYPAVWILFGLFLLFALQTWLLKKLFSRRESTLNRGAAAAVALAVFLMNGLGARGSVGLFPLSEMDTHISSNEFINLLSYNSVHAFSRAIQNKSRVEWNSNLHDFGYGDDARHAWADCFKIPEKSVPEDPRALLHRKTAPNPWAEKTKPHVVVVVMESLGGYWFRYDQEPFDLVGGLKPILAQEPHLMTFVSATGATIGSLSSLMAGVPHRPASDFLTEGMYLSTPLRTAPARIYKNAGYQTRFIYAGNPGWRDIGKYARLQGFDAVEGDVEVAQALGHELEHHDWGLYDEDIFKHVEKILAKATTPQMILVMTTANHPPYQLPSKAKEPMLQVPEELESRLLGDHAVDHRRFVTFRYSNDRLADFLKALDQMHLSEKTAVAITGDHGFWIVNFNESEQLSKSSVPLILKLPEAIRKPFPTNTFGMHADLWPTMYNLTLSNTEYESASSDLMDPAAPHYAFHHGNLILGPPGAVFVAHSVHGDHAYDWKDERLTASTGSAAHDAMALRYRCLMGLLDDFFHRERQGSKDQ